MKGIKITVSLFTKTCLAIFPCWLFLFAFLVLKAYLKYESWPSGVHPIDKDFLRAIVFWSGLLVPIALLGGMIGVGILWRISRAFPYRITLFLFLQIVIFLLLRKYDPGELLIWLGD